MSMRILFMTQVLPLPLDAGPKIRAYHVIRYLAEAGHEVHLLSFVRASDSEQQIAQLRELCASVETVPLVRSRLRDVRDGVRSILGSTPFLILRDDLPAMHQKLAEMTSRRTFDALHADQLWMAPYGMNGVQAGLRVLDQHNAVFTVPSRMAEHEPNQLSRTLLRGEARKLRAFEREACDRFDRVVWVTDQDRQAVATPEDDGRSQDLVIPIAVDPESKRPVGRPHPFRVTFLGGMHWPPNREGIAWFAEHVWPRVAREAPEAVLTLVGKDAGKVLTHPPERVELAGYVDDLEPYLTETSVFVVPLRSGAGMRVKILDAWCWGLPVVSTTLGAEGLEARGGENMLLADDAETFADAVLTLLHDSSTARQLADNGRATVLSHYDWKRVYPAWDQVYSS